MRAPPGVMGMTAALGCFGRCFRPYRGRVALVLATIAVDVAFDTILPLSLKFLIDHAITPGDSRVLALVIGGLAAGMLVVTALQVWRDYLYAWLATHVLHDLRTGMFRHISGLSPGFFLRHPTGDLVSRFSADLAGIEHAIAFGLPSILVSGLHVIVSTATLLILDWRPALVVLAGLPLCLLGPRLISPHALRFGQAMRREQGSLMARLQENLVAQPVVKAFNLGEASDAAFRRRSLRLLSFGLRFNFLSFLAERTPNIGVLVLNVAALGGGAYLAFRGDMTIGTLVAFNALFANVSASVMALSSIVPTLIQATGAMQRVQEILDEKPSVVDRPDARDLGRLETAIVLEDVAFSHTGARPDVHAVSLVVNRGERVALVGPSGSGKSTVLGLILRFDDPDRGRVLFDGVDLRDVRRASLYDQVAVVFQDSVLFDASIRENIRIGKPGAGDDEVEAAARAAELHDAVMAMPLGYDTPVGERGGRLSGGQRQRVAIARALIRDPAVLILDEATSALDPATEAAINRTLDRVARGRTTLMVTHRLAGAVQCDRICVFRDGTIVESGSFASLMAADGVFAQLWRRQDGISLSDDGHEAHVTAERLRAIPLLEGMDRDSLRVLAEHFATEHVPAGRTLFSGREPSRRLWIVVRGRVELVAGDAPEGRRVAVLEDGDHVDDSALARDPLDAAAAVTLTPCVLLSLHADLLDGLLERLPHLRRRLAAAAASAGAAPERAPP